MAVAADAVAITTIIPTLCEASRARSLLCAIDSVLAASSSPVRLIIVVNGQRFDPELVANLRGRVDIEVVQVAEGSLTRAHLTGRQQVLTPYFSFLDDDDEYLPGALDLRRRALEQDPDADLVVTNGYHYGEGSVELAPS